MNFKAELGTFKHMPEGNSTLLQFLKSIGSAIVLGLDMLQDHLEILQLRVCGGVKHGMSGGNVGALPDEKTETRKRLYTVATGT